MKNKPAALPSATKPSGDHPENVQRRGWAEIVTVASGVVNIGLFILGAVGAYLLYQQIVLMRESNEATRLSNELSLRAWVGVEAVEELAIVPGPSKLLIRLHNTGNTPASNVNVVTGFRVRETPLPENELLLAEGQITPSRFFVGAGESVSVPFAGPELTEQGAGKIRNGTLRFYIVGAVTYEDVFGIRRETRFCALHETQTDVWARCQHDNWIK